MLAKTKAYDLRFFSELRSQSLESAEVILPHLMRWLTPTSLIEVGCGEGAWLHVANKLGVKDIYGIDGDYIEPDRLLIDRSRFKASDLVCPPVIDRRFDLAICLEVGEHLPPEASTPLVKYLVSLSPVILFSAAIPGQGGTQHVNEQWPSYWQSLFCDHGYDAADCIRPLVWSNPNVAWWYAQNSVIFADRAWLSSHPEIVAQKGVLPSLVHPGLLAWKLAYLRNPNEMSVMELCRFAFRSARRCIKRDRQTSRAAEAKAP